jgi:hypothetical protein
MNALDGFALTHRPRDLSRRMRNTRHARNTRLRKKAYIENLKQSVSELSAHREKVQQEERLRLRHVQQEQNDFFSTLHQLFEYRTTRECDPEKWKELITDDFIMTLPITPYRSFSPSEVRVSPSADVGPPRGKAC